MYCLPMYFFHSRGQIWCVILIWCVTHRSWLFKELPVQHYWKKKRRMEMGVGPHHAGSTHTRTHTRARVCTHARTHTHTRAYARTHAWYFFFFFSLYFFLIFFYCNMQACRQALSKIIRQQFDKQAPRRTATCSTAISDSLDGPKAYHCAGAVLRSVSNEFSKVDPVRSCLQRLSKKDAETAKLPVDEVNSK